MKKLAILFSSIFLLSCFVKAEILEFGEEKIVFSPSKIQKGVTWSDGFSLKETGLETEQFPKNESHNIWLQTHAFPIGLSWRPPSGANFNVYFDGTINDFDPKIYELEPQIFIRYSCDKVNWSTWYNFEKTTKKSKEGSTIYESKIWLPASATENYQNLMREWWKTDPIWSSDETEFCEWLIKKDADFFVKEKPFIGYIQLRIEKLSVNKPQTIKSMNIQYIWGVSGMATIPKDKSKVRKNTEDRWFFVGK